MVADQRRAAISGRLIRLASGGLGSLGHDFELGARTAALRANNGLPTSLERKADHEVRPETRSARKVSKGCQDIFLNLHPAG